MSAHDLMLGLVVATFATFAVVLFGVSLWAGGSKG